MVGSGGSKPPAPDLPSLCSTGRDELVALAGTWGGGLGGYEARTLLKHLDPWCRVVPRTHPGRGVRTGTTWRQCGRRSCPQLNSCSPLAAAGCSAASGRASCAQRARVGTDTRLAGVLGGGGWAHGSAAGARPFMLLKHLLLLWVLSGCSLLGASSLP